MSACNTGLSQAEVREFLAGRARALKRCPGGKLGIMVRDLTAKCVEPVYRTLCPGEVGYEEALSAKRIDHNGRPYAVGGDCNPMTEMLGWTGDPRAPVRCVPNPAGARTPRPGKLAGLGDAASDLRALPLPGALERYLATGAPMSTVRRDFGAATAQIPRLGYAALAALALLLAGAAYRRWRDQ